jgi:hypothetical protein
MLSAIIVYVNATSVYEVMNLKILSGITVYVNVTPVYGVMNLNIC